MAYERLFTYVNYYASVTKCHQSLKTSSDVYDKNVHVLIQYMTYSFVHFLHYEYIRDWLHEASQMLRHIDRYP